MQPEEDFRLLSGFPWVDLTSPKYSTYQPASLMRARAAPVSPLRGIASTMLPKFVASSPTPVTSHPCNLPVRPVQDKAPGTGEPMDSDHRRHDGDVHGDPRHHGWSTSPSRKLWRGC